METNGNSAVWWEAFPSFSFFITSIYILVIIKNRERNVTICKSANLKTLKIQQQCVFPEAITLVSIETTSTEGIVEIVDSVFCD